jgi:hypothetical protein
MDDFSPGGGRPQGRAARKLLEARTQLSNLLTYMDGKSGAEDLLGKVLKDPELLKALARAQAAGSGAMAEAQQGTQSSRSAGSRFSSRALRLGPPQEGVQAQDQQRQEAIESAVQTLAEQALARARR